MTRVYIATGRAADTLHMYRAKQVAVKLVGPQKLGNMGLYVHRTHQGLLGTGKLGGGGGGREFLYLAFTRYTVTTRMTLH